MARPKKAHEFGQVICFCFPSQTFYRKCKSGKNVSFAYANMKNPDQHRQLWLR
jgi:hypothetical protein